MTTHTLPSYQIVHLADVAPRSRFFQRWERVRHRQAHWFVECAAESLGVFLFVFGGLGANAAWVLGNYTGDSMSSLFQVGIAYAIGVVLAMVICGATSGGHFNPAVTMCFVVFKKFPPLKAVRYILAQTFGAYVACLLIYVSWRHIIMEVESTLKANGTFDDVNYTPSGLAGIFALYSAPGASLGQSFVAEFVSSFVIGVTVWGCLDPTNFMNHPVVHPWIVAFVYAMAIWGFAPVGLCANTARDVGSRFMAMSIWGAKASGGASAAITALTNIPATFMAALFYEFVLTDSSRVITPGHAAALAGYRAHAEHRNGAVTLESVDSPRSSPSSYDSDKQEVETVEIVEVV